MNEQYLTLDALAARLGLPKDYLRNLVEKKQIPCLDVNGRLRFNEHNVRDAFDRLECHHRERQDGGTTS